MKEIIVVKGFNSDDVQELVKIHMAAFKGYMNVGIGVKYVTAFLNWFLKYTETITLKAQIGDVICGYVVGAPIGYDKKINRDLFRKAFTGIVTHPFILLHENFKRAAIAKLKVAAGEKATKIVIKNPDGKGISLVGIAVDPQFSGKGIGFAIMQEFERKAKELKMDYMRLSVFDDNINARALYVKAGWKIMQKAENKTLYYYKANQCN